MADLPSKLDKLLEILETIAREEEISLNSLARKLNTKIANIKIYLDYLEELGLIYRWKDGRGTRIRIVADVVAKVGETMVAITNGKAFVWRCPFTEICDYYEHGCTTVNNCIFMQAFAIAIDNAIEEFHKRKQKENEQ